MRRALAADFAAAEGGTTRVIVTLDARLPDDPGPWTIERIAPGQAEHQVTELARAADFTVLVAPETTGILSGLTRAVQSTGARLLGSLDDAIQLTGDKERFGRWLEARGIPTPRSRTIQPAEGLPADVKFPAVLKPIDGAGSVDTFYLCEDRLLPAAALEMPYALLQPFVAGNPMSASFLVDSDQRAWLIGVGTQNVTVHDGRFEYRGGRLPAPRLTAEPQLRPIVESIPGLKGFVGVDFVWDEACGRMTVLEINPRPTTSCVGLARLLSPGQLADAWLGAVDRRWGNAGLLDSLADRVHGSRPLSFDASGVVSFDRSDVE